MPTLHIKMVPIKAHSFEIQEAATSIPVTTGPASACVKSVGDRMSGTLANHVTSASGVGRLADFIVPDLVDKCYNHVVR
jgi:hypothetical protein